MGKSSLNNVLKLISGAFKSVKKPLTPLPPPLILTGSNLRTGLSAKDITARILARQSEAGAPVGNVFSENGNISEKMELIRVEEIIKSLHLEGKVEIVIAPGVQVTAMGIGNLGGPVVSQGATTSLAYGQGVIR
jgi:hypothetical protein